MIHRFSLIEKLLLAGDVLPHPLLDTALIGTSKALTLAAKTGLCDHLDAIPRKASELAQKSGLSERGVTALCDCLDALGYVRASSAGYAFTKRGQKFLAKDAAGTTQLAKLTTSFMALNLLHQASGFTYSLDEVKRWCRACGFLDVALKKLRAPGFAVIVATR